MIVTDASAFLEFLLRTPGGLFVDELVAANPVAAPHLFEAEVFHRLIRMRRHAELNEGALGDHLRRLRHAAVTRYAHGPLLVAARHYTNAVSGYDALYVALAVRLHAPLVTADARLARTVSEQFALPVTTVPTSGR